MFSEFMYELKWQARSLLSALKSREFWIYFAIVLVLAGIAGVGIYMAAGFDPLTRGNLGLGFSCQTGQGQLATIIVGGVVFFLACAVTLGEFINWIDALKSARLPGHQSYEVGFWRPLLHLVGVLLLALAGFTAMSVWCS